MSERHYGDRVQRGGFWDRSNVKPDTDHIRASFTPLFCCLFGEHGDLQCGFTLATFGIAFNSELSCDFVKTRRYSANTSALEPAS